MITEPGIYPGLSRLDYGNIEATNHSSLTDHVFGPPDESVARRMFLGSTLHEVVLDYEATAPKVHLCAARRGSKEWEEECIAFFDHIVLKPEEAAAIKAQRQAIEAHPEMALILEKRVAHELCLVWKDEHTGVLCKGLVDIQTNKALCDIKTTGAHSADDFELSVAKFNYLSQAAMYLDGWTALRSEPKAWAWLCVQNRPPYQTWITRPTDAQLIVGRHLYRAMLCAKTGRSPGNDFIHQVEASLAEVAPTDTTVTPETLGWWKPEATDV